MGGYGVDLGTLVLWYNAILSQNFCFVKDYFRTRVRFVGLYKEQVFCALRFLVVLYIPRKKGAIVGSLPVGATLCGRPMPPFANASVS